MPEGTDFLYPFIEGDERDADALLADLGALGRGEGRGERARCGAPRSTAVAGPTSTPRRRRWPSAFAGGGRLFTFGNGGSSTDAASLAALFARPPWGRPLPARGLVEDTAVAHRARPTTSASTWSSPGS